MKQRKSVGFGTGDRVDRQGALAPLGTGIHADGGAGVLYNAIFFTYALILTKFYNVPSDSIGWYLLPFAAGNFLGPVLLGRLFDSIGRRVMISSTYIISGVGLASLAICSSRMTSRPPS